MKVAPAGSDPADRRGLKAGATHVAPWHVARCTSYNRPVPAIGQSIPRKEGRRKVTGEARYVDDLALPGMLH